MAGARLSTVVTPTTRPPFPLWPPMPDWRSAGLTGTTTHLPRTMQIRVFMAQRGLRNGEPPGILRASKSRRIRIPMVRAPWDRPSVELHGITPSAKTRPIVTAPNSDKAVNPSLFTATAGNSVALQEGLCSQTYNQGPMARISSTGTDPYPRSRVAALTAW